MNKTKKEEKIIYNVIISILLCTSSNNCASPEFKAQGSLPAELASDI